MICGLGPCVVSLGTLPPAAQPVHRPVRTGLGRVANGLAGRTWKVLVLVHALIVHACLL
jgi:hypothetical protein